MGYDDSVLGRVSIFSFGSTLSCLLGALEKYIQLITPHDNCRHNKAIDHLYGDVDELNGRVRGANQRGRRLLGK